MPDRVYAARLVFVIIVRHFVERHALAERVLIRGYQLGIYPQFIFIGAGGKLGALIVESAAYSRSRVAQKLLKIGRALARAVYSVALAVEFIEKLRKAVIALGSIRRAVLVYLFKREIERLAGFVLEHSRLAEIRIKPVFYALKCGAYSLTLCFVGTAGLNISPARLRYLAAYERRRALDAAEQRG